MIGLAERRFGGSNNKILNLLRFDLWLLTSGRFITDQSY